jgi:hypothetical protein
MKIKFFVLLGFILLNSSFLGSQIDSSILRLEDKDTAAVFLNMDAVYKRPFIALSKLPLSIGGYAEVNWQHVSTDGITEGHQLQMRRMTLFVASAISDRIKFLSEIEFEEGGHEVAIEFAAVDFEFHPLLNLRAGIIMNPIGAFNQNHDGPKWEFTDRPISATQMLAATWSNSGFGIYGKYFKDNWMVGYESYLSGGFDQSIIENDLNKTYLKSSKKNHDRFEEGNLLLTGKFAIRNNRIGELGLSYMGGVYNNHTEDGIKLDKKRRVNVYAIDFNTSIPKINTSFIAEWAWVTVDIPDTYSQQFGRKQHGGFLDIIQPVFKRKILGWDDAVINISCRLEYVDWNVGKFKENDQNIGDHLWSIMPSISFRPTQQAVIRLNYRIQEQTDLFTNPAAKTKGWNFGISSYF